MTILGLILIWLGYGFVQESLLTEVANRNPGVDKNVVIICGWFIAIVLAISGVYIIYNAWN